MIFPAPTIPAGAPSLPARLRRPAVRPGRAPRRHGDEDEARRAFGAAEEAAPARRAGAIEHLARIALC